MKASRNQILNLDDKPVKVLGRYSTPSTWDESVLVRFIVVENAPHPVLLGMDLLRARKAAINLKSMQLVVGRRRFPLRAKKHRLSSLVSITSTEETLIPALIWRRWRSPVSSRAGTSSQRLQTRLSYPPVCG